VICNVDLRNKYISNKHDTNSGGEPEHCIVNQAIEFPRGLDNFLKFGVAIEYLQTYADPKFLAKLLPKENTIMCDHHLSMQLSTARTVYLKNI
jgi:hypothetical protein